MSMTLILWKEPVVREPEEAEALLKPWYDHMDSSAFEPSEAVGLVTAELHRRYPYPAPDSPEDSTSPWAEPPVDQDDRLLVLTIRWGADDAALDDITALAREHGLVLYDPQGPDIHLPDDPEESGEAPPIGFRGYATIFLFGLGAVALFLIGWHLPVPVLNWLLMAAGAFLGSVVIFLFAILIFAPSEEPAPRR